MKSPVVGPITQKILTIHEAADFLRVSTRTLYGASKPRGPIPCLRVGPRGVRYTMDALERFIREQENGEPQTEA